MNENELTGEVIGAAIDVHRALGPGLMESVYEECLSKELQLRGIPHERQVPVPLVYKGSRVDLALRIDLVVEGKLVVELKAVDRIVSIHEAQLLTYLRLHGAKVGLLINFNEERLRDGIRRRVLQFSASSSAPSAPLR